MKISANVNYKTKFKASVQRFNFPTYRIDSTLEVLF